LGWNKVYDLQNTGFNLLGKKLFNNGDRVEKHIWFQMLSDVSPSREKTKQPGLLAE